LGTGERGDLVIYGIYSMIGVNDIRIRNRIRVMIDVFDRGNKEGEE
jgi:hypothetical protein